jgi:long-chain acyl-CoA synthetase
MLGDACQRFADKPAFTHAGVTHSYRSLDERSRRFAAWLQQAGFAPGERLAILLPNLPQYLVALLGAWRAGLVVVNVNPLYTAREIEHQLADAGATVLITLDSLLPRVREVRSQLALRHVLVTAVGEWSAETAADGPAPTGLEIGELALATALAKPASASWAPTPRGMDDLALLQYTGGTTGVSKGAMLTHGNLVTNVAQGKAWYGGALLDGQETVLTVLPLYHVFALSFNGLMMLSYGAHLRLVSSPRDGAALMAALQAGCSVISGVNTLYAGLMDAPGFAALDWRGLKIAVSGGASAQLAIVERWEQATGQRIIEGYGLTETSPFALSNSITERFGGGLLPMPSTDVAIRDDAGADLPPGHDGELCIRGPQVMRGYWQRPDETAAVLSADGWLRTGDIAQMDADGRLRITDRKKDMVLVSGFNVYPNEVEDVLARHPGVSECAVVGVPDPRTGEAVRAYVVRRDATLTEAALESHARGALTAYKVPRQFVFVDQLPKTPVGKILRRTLRDVALKESS